MTSNSPTPVVNISSSKFVDLILESRILGSGSRALIPAFIVSHEPKQVRIILLWEAQNPIK